MNKKYSSGNEYFSDSFSLCNYEINLNNIKIILETCDECKSR